MDELDRDLAYLSMRENPQFGKPAQSLLNLIEQFGGGSTANEVVIASPEFMALTKPEKTAVMVYVATADLTTHFGMAEAIHRAALAAEIVFFYLYGGDPL